MECMLIFGEKNNFVKIGPLLVRQVGARAPQPIRTGSFQVYKKNKNESSS